MPGEFECLGIGIFPAALPGMVCILWDWESQPDAPGIPLRIRSVSTFSEPRVQDES